MAQARRRKPPCPVAVPALLAAAAALAAGCTPPAAAPPPPPGFTADTATPAGLASGAAATEAGCRALPDGLWVAAAGGRRQECLRYAAAGTERGAGRTALVHIPGDAAGAAYGFAGGRPWLEAAGGPGEASAAARRALAQALSRAAGGAPVVLIGRPGMHGSSGDHAHDRHTRDEVELVDAALTALRRRHGFRDLALSGFSSGGAVAANLLARRGDIRCAAIASAPLDLAAFHQAQGGAAAERWALQGARLADPMRAVAAAAAARPGAEVLVLGDPRDRAVPPAAWEAWAAAARRAGLRVATRAVEAGDPAGQGGALGGTPGGGHHETAAHALAAAAACAAAGGPVHHPPPPPPPGAG